MRRTYDIAPDQYTVRGSGIATGGYYHPEDHGDGGPSIEDRERAERAANIAITVAGVASLAVVSLIGIAAYATTRKRRR